MHDDSARVRRRLDRFVDEWLTPAIYRDASDLRLEIWEVADEPVPFADAKSATYAPFAAGDAYGKPWGTTWFRVRGEVPSGWRADGLRAEVVLDIGFTATTPGFQVEGTAYTPDGVIVKAVENFNRYIPVDEAADSVDLYVEVASNPDVQQRGFTIPTPLGSKDTAGTDPLYRFRSAQVRSLDLTVWELDGDLRVLAQLHDQLPEWMPRRAIILRAIEDALDALDPDDVAGTAESARRILAPVLAAPAFTSAHQLYAVGHAHIDSAWLWPTRETVRKVARTFSNVLHLMDVDPDFVFAASSAQQYAWLKEFYPELFERVRARVAEGRFAPTGGMWVESDTNMVGGEALIRQFVEGKAFFREEFGVEPTEVWLPDSFGFTAALPQIATITNTPRLLTQKISWNDTNRMPHHSFLWRGIDGSEIFTHFPPVDSYNARMTGAELALAERQFRESGRANRSLVPFGYGDGGGGPTREMLAAAHRTADLEGSPQVRLSSPSRFFADAEEEYETPPVWDGELYLEFHRGVYTTQHRTKAGNRRSEHLLHAAELWATTATVLRGVEYPAAELQRIWRLVLLQQFHDILPGTSIAWVHREAERNYEAIARDLEAIIDASVAALAGPGDLALTANSSPFAVAGVGAGAIGVVAATASTAAAVAHEGGYRLENEHLRVTIDDRGFIVSLVDLAAGRELVADGHPLAVLTVYRDTPNDWEAWDIDEFYKHNPSVIDRVDSITLTQDAGAATVRIERTRGASSFVQTIGLRAGSSTVDLETEVDWHERQKLLKLSFPLRVHAAQASSEIQFGHIRRPITVNTSWDAARFETVAHRWVHVGEPGYGVGVANNSTYGHNIVRESVPGATLTVVNQTLLRAPVMPDPGADQGRHVLKSALVVRAGIAETSAEGYRLNQPQTVLRGGSTVDALVRVTGAGAVLETVKLARDGSGDVVVRLYESLGDHAEAALAFAFPIARVTRTDALERPLDDSELAASDGVVPVSLTPFQIVTLRIRRG